MHNFSRTGLILVLAVSLLAPSMACAFPGSQMTRAEHACCRRMSGECGGMKMPASHSCCQKNVEASHIDAVQPQAAAFHPAIAVVAVLPASMEYSPFAFALQPVQQCDHSPPRSPGSAISILRI